MSDTELERLCETVRAAGLTTGHADDAEMLLDEVLSYIAVYQQRAMGLKDWQLRAKRLLGHSECSQYSSAYRAPEWAAERRALIAEADDGGG